jgi:hypothetical protein
MLLFLAMAQIDQVQIRYVPSEDRLLMRVKTRDLAEFRFWLTRRFVLLLWPVLMRIIKSSPDVSLQANPAAREAVLSFRHEHAVQQTNFAAGYREDAISVPLGDAPILLVRLQVRERGDGSKTLSLQPEKGRGIDLHLTEVLLHSLCKLLADGVRTASWGLDTRIAPPGPAVAPTPAQLN